MLSSPDIFQWSFVKRSDINIYFTGIYFVWRRQEAGINQIICAICKLHNHVIRKQLVSNIYSALRILCKFDIDLEPVCSLLTLGCCGAGVESIHLFKELILQPKLDIFRGVKTKPLDTPVNYELLLYFTMQKITSIAFTNKKRVDTINPHSLKVKKG